MVVIREHLLEVIETEAFSKGDAVKTGELLKSQNAKQLSSIVDTCSKELRNGPVLFMIGKGGGGHKASGYALRDCLVQEGVSWASRIEFMDSGEQVEIALNGRLANCLPSGDDLYNLLMKYGMYSMAGGISRVGTAIVKCHKNKIRQHFSKLWKEKKPALVVSFVPFMNSMMREALSTTDPDCKIVTVVTDMANSPAHVWIDPCNKAAANHYIVAGNSVLEKQARELGYTDQVMRTTGMVVNPIYYTENADQIPVSESTRPTAVLFFGAYPPMRTAQIAKKALSSHPDLDLVIICGRNNKLRSEVEKLPKDRCIVEGFISPERVRDYFAHAALVVGKPGPGTVSEAAVCHVPFVTEEKAMCQEMCVLDWIKENGTGVVVKSLESLPEDLLTQVDHCRTTVGSANNRAVYEVSSFLRTLMFESETSTH